MGVKCLAQEHNTVPQPGREPGPFDPESSALTIRPPRLTIIILHKRYNNIIVSQENIKENLAGTSKSRQQSLCFNFKK